MGTHHIQKELADPEKSSHKNYSDKKPVVDNLTALAPPNVAFGHVESIFTEDIQAHTDQDTNKLESVQRRVAMITNILLACQQCFRISTGAPLINDP